MSVKKFNKKTSIYSVSGAVSSCMCFGSNTLYTKQFTLKLLNMLVN